MFAFLAQPMQGLRRTKTRLLIRHLPACPVRVRVSQGDVPEVCWLQGAGKSRLRPEGDRANAASHNVFFSEGIGQDV